MEPIRGTLPQGSIANPRQLSDMSGEASGTVGPVAVTPNPLPKESAVGQQAGNAQREVGGNQANENPLGLPGVSGNPRGETGPSTGGAVAPVPKPNPYQNVPTSKPAAPHPGPGREGPFPGHRTTIEDALREISNDPVPSKAVPIQEPAQPAEPKPPRETKDQADRLAAKEAAAQLASEALRVRREQRDQQAMQAMTPPLEANPKTYRVNIAGEKGDHYVSNGNIQIKIPRNREFVVSAAVLEVLKQSQGLVFTYLPN